MFRTPTKRMLDKLRDCHDKVTKSGGLHPCLQEDLKGSLSGLYKRGLVDTRVEDINGKKLLCLVVTDAGVALLKKLESKETSQ